MKLKYGFFALLFFLGIIFMTSKTLKNKYRIIYQNASEKVFGPATSHTEIRWLEAKFVIGGKDTKEEFFPNAVDIDADSLGNIYVLDSKDFRVNKYDTKGRHVQNIGRQGQGPGEFVSVGSIAISRKDRIYVLDYGEIEIFDVNGKYLQTIKIWPPANQLSITPQESIICGYRTVTEDDGKIGYFYHVGIYDLQTNKFKSFYDQLSLKWERLSTSDSSLTIPLFVKFAVDSSGNIYVGTADKYEVNVFSPRAEFLYKFKKEYPRIPIESSVRKALYKTLESLMTAPERKKYDQHLQYYSVFDSFSLDEENNLWVKIFKHPDDDQSEESTFYEVFSSSGRLLYCVRAHKSIDSKLIFKNHRIYALSKDMSGFSEAVVFAMSKNRSAASGDNLY